MGPTPVGHCSEIGLEYRELVQKKDCAPDIHEYTQSKYFIASYSSDTQIVSLPTTHGIHLL